MTSVEFQQAEGATIGAEVVGGPELLAEAARCWGVSRTGFIVPSVERITHGAPGVQARAFHAVTLGPARNREEMAGKPGRFEDNRPPARTGAPSKSDRVPQMAENKGFASIG
jgi:hypothetical protein